MGKISEGHILVTGAAGFIGSCLIAELNARGHGNIIAVDLLTDDRRYRTLVPLEFSDYLEADDLLARVENHPNGLPPIHTVFHLGARASTAETDCRRLIKDNYEYTKTLAEWAVARGIRFVYASSAATYGDGSAGMDDGEECIPNLRPLNPYGYSKQLFDRHALRRGMLPHIYGMKYFNIFGPNELHKGAMASMVLRAYRQIRDTGRVQLFKSHRPEFADGCQRRDFLYVKDAVAMTIFLATLPGKSSGPTGGIFNVGSGHASTWLELVSPVFRAMGVEERIEFVAMPPAIRAHYQYYTYANIGKIRRAGYGTAITPLAEAVTDYVTNHLIPLGDGALTP
jgi:ADP-L-glycero-D-manno-heptose 6-epimerase